MPSEYEDWSVILSGAGSGLEAVPPDPVQQPWKLALPGRITGGPPLDVAGTTIGGRFQRGVEVGLATPLPAIPGTPTREGQRLHEIATGREIGAWQRSLEQIQVFSLTLIPTASLDRLIYGEATTEDLVVVVLAFTPPARSPRGPYGLARSLWTSPTFARRFAYAKVLGSVAKPGVWKGSKAARGAHVFLHGNPVLAPIAAWHMKRYGRDLFGAALTSRKGALALLWVERMATAFGRGPFVPTRTAAWLAGLRRLYGTETVNAFLEHPLIRALLGEFVEEKELHEQFALDEIDRIYPIVLADVLSRPHVREALQLLGFL